MCLIFLPATYLFSMDQPTAREIVLHDNNLLNLIVREICITNQCELRNVHHDLASLKCANTQLNTYCFAGNYHQNIIDLFAQYHYIPTHRIALQLRFPIYTAIKALKTRVENMETNELFSKEELEQCSTLRYGSELVRMTLKLCKTKAAKQLLQMPKLHLPQCNAAHCNQLSESDEFITQIKSMDTNSMLSENKITQHKSSYGKKKLSFASSCPLIIATDLILFGHNNSLTETDLLDIVNLLLKNYKFDPNHYEYNDKNTILIKSICNENKKLIQLFIENGADPYRKIKTLVGRFTVFDIILHAKWVEEMYKDIQEKKTAQNSSLTN